jgi:hypothetical protein
LERVQLNGVKLRRDKIEKAGTEFLHSREKKFKSVWKFVDSESLGVNSAHE